MKPNHPVKKVVANLDLLRFPTDDAKQGGTHCLNCNSRLVLHQPDLDAPDRLLGVCERCKHWFLIDVLADMTGEIMVRLPDVEVIRALSRENPEDGISVMSQNL